MHFPVPKLQLDKKCILKYIYKSSITELDTTINPFVLSNLKLITPAAFFGALLIVLIINKSKAFSSDSKYSKISKTVGIRI